MTEKIIKTLPELLKNHICTLKKASTDTTNKISMCESNLKVIDFDKIPKEFARGRGWSCTPTSNDALYIDVYGKWYFVEFKNGTIRKDEIYRKLYDSLIILMEQKIIPSFDFMRQNINYILVYNEKKYGKIQPSPARDHNYAYIFKLAKQEERLFDIEKFDGYLFHETHTYTTSLFEKNFIQPKELEETTTPQ